MSKDRATGSGLGFAKLESSNRHVSRAAIRKKWKKLPGPAQQRVRNLFRSIEKPPMTHALNSRKDLENHSAISAMLRILESRIPRMPFPPSTLDGDFDFETILDRKRALDNQFTSNTHSIALLESEIKREEKALEAEEAKLRRLQSDLKNTELMRRKQTKNIHFLAQEFAVEDTRSTETDGKAQLPRKTLDIIPSASKDPLLVPILTQLSSHLQSMENAAKQTSGISEALSKSQAALDIFAGQ